MIHAAVLALAQNLRSSRQGGVRTAASNALKLRDDAGPGAEEPRWLTSCIVSIDPRSQP
jgi:hypothetical protein